MDSANPFTNRLIERVKDELKVGNKQSIKSIYIIEKGGDIGTGLAYSEACVSLEDTSTFPLGRVELRKDPRQAILLPLRYINLFPKHTQESH